jgi:multidrug efflux pump
VLVTGMIVGTLFTLIVVPVFYLLIASEHKRVEVESGGSPVEQPA